MTHTTQQLITFIIKSTSSFWLNFGPLYASTFFWFMLLLAISLLIFKAFKIRVIIDAPKDYHIVFATGAGRWNPADPRNIRFEKVKRPIRPLPHQTVFQQSKPSAPTYKNRFIKAVAAQVTAGLIIAAVVGHVNKNWDRIEGTMDNIQHPKEPPTWWVDGKIPTPALPTHSWVIEESKEEKKSSSCSIHRLTQDDSILGLANEDEYLTVLHQTNFDPKVLVYLLLFLIIFTVFFFTLRQYKTFWFLPFLSVNSNLNAQDQKIFYPSEFFSSCVQVIQGSIVLTSIILAVTACVIWYAHKKIFYYLYKTMIIYITILSFCLTIVLLLKTSSIHAYILHLLFISFDFIPDLLNYDTEFFYGDWALNVIKNNGLFQFLNDRPASLQKLLSWHTSLTKTEFISRLQEYGLLMPSVPSHVITLYFWSAYWYPILYLFERLSLHFFIIHQDFYLALGQEFWYLLKVAAIVDLDTLKSSELVWLLNRIYNFLYPLECLTRAEYGL